MTNFSLDFHRDLIIKVASPGRGDQNPTPVTCKINNNLVQNPKFLKTFWKEPLNGSVAP